MLSKRLIEFNDQKATQFSDLLAALQQDLEPIDTLEQLLVEKIAYEYWRLAVVSYYQNDQLRGGYVFAEREDTLIRYEAMINRQLFQAINQLERLQRLRRGENVPAPLKLQVSHEISDEKRSGD